MKITKKELFELYIDKKLSICEIEKVVKIKKVTLYWYMRKYNIPRRNWSIAGKMSWDKGISKVTPKMREANLMNVVKARQGITGESRKKQAETMMKKYDDGMKPWNWQENGQSELNRRVRRPRWRKLADKIRKRDNYTCQKCGRKNCILQVHHIDKNDNNNCEKNLITVCCGCHMHLHNYKDIIGKKELNYLYHIKKLSLRKIGKIKGTDGTVIMRYCKYFSITTRSLSDARKQYFANHN